MCLQTNTHLSHTWNKQRIFTIDNHLNSLKSIKNTKLTLSKYDNDIEFVNV